MSAIVYRQRPIDQIDISLDVSDLEQLSRRRFLIRSGGLLGAAAAVAAGLAGCGSAAPSAGAPGASGSAEPAVVALDEFAGLSALSLGVKPASVFLTFSYASAKAVFDFAGVPTTAAAPDGVNLESVVSLKPSAIIGVSIPTTAAVQDKLNAIAPTTVLEYTASWQEQLRATGAAIGRQDAAEAINARIERTITALKDELASAGKAGQTVSVIGALGSDAFALSRTGSVGSLIEQLGLRRPPAQDVATEATNPFIPISAERLEDHNADLIFLLSGGAYAADALTGSALWPTLGAVKAQQVISVVAELWFSSNAFGIDWIARDVRAALLADGAIATDADVVSRWQAFTSAEG